MKNLLSLIMDCKNEVDEIIRSKLENYLSNMNLINFDEYTILSDKIVELSNVNKELAERLTILEQKINLNGD